MTAPVNAPLIGLFVGGKARRMGGIPKGLLPAPGEARSVAARLRDLCSDVTRGKVVLVGDAAAYAELGLETITDDPVGVGPLGGLHALLKYGESLGCEHVFSLACDMPYVTIELLARLTSELPSATVLAPKSQGRWQPFFARFRPSAARPVVTALLEKQTSRALQAVFDGLGSDAQELLLTSDEERCLRDWDTPEDVHR